MKVTHTNNSVFQWLRLYVGNSLVNLVYSYVYKYTYNIYVYIFIDICTGRQ